MVVKISGNSSPTAPSFAGDDGDSGLHASANEVQLVTNSTVAVTVDSSQNVGIGTTTPSSILDIQTGSGNLEVDALGATSTKIRHTTTGGILALEGHSGIRFDKSSASEMARFDDSGYLRFASGTGGIQFNGETTANHALDDYEEGVWTPDLSFDGGTTGITYGTRAGTFTRIGNIVWCRFILTLSSKGTSTGTPRIGGLPFTVKNALTGTSLEGAGEITYHGNRGTQTGAQKLFPTDSTAYASVYLLFDDGTSSTNATELAFTNSSSLRGYVWYYV